MGVDRGALADKFPDEMGGNVHISHEKGTNWRLSSVVNGATLGLPVEDLAHLNPKHSQSIARQVSARAARRRQERVKA